MTIAAVCTSQAQIAAAFLARKRELGLSNLDLDDIAGLQQGYAGKLLCGVKSVGVMSFTAVAGALGFLWHVIKDEDGEPRGLVLIADDAVLPRVTRHYLGSRRLSAHDLYERRMGRVAPSLLGGYMDA